MAELVFDVLGELDSGTAPVDVAERLLLELASDEMRRLRIERCTGKCDALAQEVAVLLIPVGLAAEKGLNESDRVVHEEVLLALLGPDPWEYGVSAPLLAKLKLMVGERESDFSPGFVVRLRDWLASLRLVEQQERLTQRLAIV